MEDVFEINAGECKNSEELVNKVVSTLDASGQRGSVVKLKLECAAVNQAQLLFVKSLIQSYGQHLQYIETSNTDIKEICRGIGLNALEPVEHDKDIENIELDTLREEFKSETKEKSEENEENPVVGICRQAKDDEYEDNVEEDAIAYYAVPTDEAIIIDPKQTIYINQTLRSGQILEYDGNVVIIGDCHPGSEVKATGDITVWGVLGSIAHAGAKGNREARIRALKINAVQLRIADCYSRRPDGGNIPYIVKSSVFVPEEARIVDNNIVLFKMAQD